MAKTPRTPAPIVKCPHCNHTGSSRGLFTHMRLAHPGIEAKPPKSVTAHPYAVQQSSVGNVSTKAVKRKKKSASISGVNDVEQALIAILAPVVANLAFNWLESNGWIKRPFPSEGIKTQRTAY